MNLSEEQNLFLDKVLAGKNVLVDAVIGSGKTTSIQKACDELPTNKKILYLTYNKLLKIDAKAKIKNKNVTVTNYHGLAYMSLIKMGIKAGMSDLIQVFNNTKPTLKYDILIIDEYQDIEKELATMLEIIKEANPGLQIIAVGDMEQKIYDKTTLNVKKFINEFLGTYETVNFTKCFRLSEKHAAMLGRVWHKTITGVNPDCKIETMARRDVVKYLMEQNPEDILCLGARTGDMSDVLNKLEEKCPEKFNKNTVFASISDTGERATEPTFKSCIFTTFDSSKGLERKICVVFDFTESYWKVRIRQPQQKYAILRNIFCVAASRGKEKIIFVKSGLEENIISEQTLSTSPDDNEVPFKDVNISEMFDFKYREDVEDCFNLITTKRIRLDDRDMIDIENHDGLIDLSPCIGIFQEANYFNGYDIDKDIKLAEEIKDTNKNKTKTTDDSQAEFMRIAERELHKAGLGNNLERKILYLTALVTAQNRYVKQVSVPFVEKKAAEQLNKRLATFFTKDELVQRECNIDFLDEIGRHAFTAKGFCDVVKDDTIFELKFKKELAHEDFLQCACYMIAYKLKRGVLWNTRTNEMFEIKIPNEEDFLNAVTICVTKGKLSEFKGNVSADIF